MVKKANGRMVSLDTAIRKLEEAAREDEMSGSYPPLACDQARMHFKKLKAAIMRQVPKGHRVWVPNPPPYTEED